MFVYRWKGLNMKNSGHYTFCTINGNVYYSFIKHGTQKNIQRCVQNHVGCEITFSTISLSYLANYLYVNLMLFLEGLEYNGSSMAI